MRGAGGFIRFVFEQAGSRAVLAIGFLVLGSLMEGISILMIVPILKMVGPHETFTFTSRHLGRPLTFGLTELLLVLIAAVTAQAWFMRFKNIYMTAITQDVANSIRLQLFKSIANARWQFVSRQRTSDLNQLVNDDVERNQAAVNALLVLIQTSVLILVYFAVSWIVSPALTLVAAALGLMLLACLAPVRGRAARFGISTFSDRRRQFRTVSQFLDGLKISKSFNAETRYLQQLQETLAKMKRDLISYSRMTSLATVASQMVTAIAIGIFVVVGFQSFHLTVTRLAVFILIFSRLTPRFQALQSNLQTLLQAMPAFDVLQSSRREFEEHSEAASARGADAPDLREALTLDRVGFSYDCADPAKRVLDDVSFTIEAMRVTALIGPSGAGKSTIADLLTGLLQPTSGTILVDGVPLGFEQSRGWRRKVAYVPQETFLLHDSIAANLAFAATDATAEEMWTALAEANAADFVRGLPEGLETIVGDRGTRLSGGERQRIALARALLAKPQLLILDEATSALDWHNQSLVAQSIEQLRHKLTVLTIAHRASMLSAADAVVTIEDGKVIEAGTFQDLASRPSSYLSRLILAEASGAAVRAQAETRFASKS